MTTEDQKQDEKLYAGKFKTVEELEAGYKNSLPTFQENEQLKKKLDDYQPPVNYFDPKDVELDTGRLEDLKTHAKETGMTQAQYEKYVRLEKQRLDSNKQNFEKHKKELGDDTLNILNDYVGKNYPKELHDVIVNKLITNKDARAAALNHREQTLRSTVNGMNKPASGGYNVTREDVKKAYEAKEKNPHDPKVRDAYLNILAAHSEQQQQAS